MNRQQILEWIRERMRRYWKRVKNLIIVLLIYFLNVFICSRQCQKLQLVDNSDYPLSLFFSHSFPVINKTIIKQNKLNKLDNYFYGHKKFSKIKF